MHRFVLIIFFYFYSVGSYGQFLVGTLKSTHFTNSLTEDISSNSLSNTTVFLTDEDNSDDVIGNTPAYNLLTIAADKSTTTYLTDCRTTFVKKLLLLYHLDLPPPVSL